MDLRVSLLTERVAKCRLFPIWDSKKLDSNECFTFIVVVNGNVFTFL